jgi:hypothetical protein
MDLVQGEQVGLAPAEALGARRRFSRTLSGLIARAVAAIERRIEAGADAAARVKKRCCTPSRPASDWA